MPRSLFSFLFLSQLFTTSAYGIRRMHVASTVSDRISSSIPYEKQIRDKAEILYRWETESRYRDSFVAAISDINEVMECYTVLMNYATEGITEIQVSEVDFPDSRL